MQNYAKILTVIDPAATSHPSLERAVWLAEKQDSELELLVCSYNEYLSGTRLYDSRSLAIAREEFQADHLRVLEQLAEPIRKRVKVVRTATRWDHPLHEGVVRHALETRADLVLKDVKEHSAIANALFSNTEWNLIRTCPVDLWLVKPRPMAEHPVILGAIDPMNEHDKPAALDDKILQRCNQLANVSGGDAHAFHAYDPRAAIATATANAYIPVSLPLDEIEEQTRESHGKRFNEICNFHGFDEAHAHLMSGLTHQELPALASDIKADVVVMGAVARNALQRLFIGATAERTLARLPCDLLILKPDWFQTPVERTNPGHD